MLRLFLLFGAVFFVTLLIAGDDKGQMRPGLAHAVAAGQEILVYERRRAPPVTIPAPIEVAADPIPVAAGESGRIALAPPAAVTPAPAAPAAAPAPVFTLSALPGIGGDRAELPAEVTVADDATSTSPSGNPVWYVSANSVNVRESPSTDASVVGRLAMGEAVSIIGPTDSEWVNIMIEGDGMKGFVARRLLSPGL